MDKIIPSYSDPLFSIFILILLILIVAVVSFFVGNYKDEIDKRSLIDFLRAIKVEESSNFQIEKLPFSKPLLKPLTTMADTLILRGDYRKAILIYLYLIENLKSFYEQEPLMVKLGDSYLKAGFLTKAEKTYLEILKQAPQKCRCSI